MPTSNTITKARVLIFCQNLVFFNMGSQKLLFYDFNFIYFARFLCFFRMFISNTFVFFVQIMIYSRKNLTFLHPILIFCDFNCKPSKSYYVFYLFEMLCSLNTTLVAYSNIIQTILAMLKVLCYLNLLRLARDTFTILIYSN